MLTIKEIQDLKTYLQDDRHSRRVKAQRDEELFYQDKFTVPWLDEDEQKFIVKRGLGFKLVNAPVNHLISDNPQVFRKPLKPKVETHIESAKRVGAEMNRWAKLLLRQTPNPFKAFPHHLMRRGEAWLHLLPNTAFDPQDKNSLPFTLAAPDPLHVFMDDLAGEWLGIPNRVMMIFERLVDQLHQRYPHWQPSKLRSGNEKVLFIAYYDKDMVYMEADGYPLMMDENGNPVNEDGRSENVLGIVPFVHQYSGFGYGDEDGDPSGLAVSRLRFEGDLIAEQAAIRSDVNFQIHTGAHPYIDVEWPAEAPGPGKDYGKEYSVGPYKINVLPIPQGGKKEKMGLPPPQEVFQHLGAIQAEVFQESPPTMQGLPSGSSGRQEDIVRSSGLMRFETIVDRTEFGFSQALGEIGLRICKLDLMPEGIKESDIGDYYNCEVKLKAEDPIERDRSVVLGERLVQLGVIDLKTFLVEHYGKTEEDAEEIMARILVDNATRNNPIIAQIMGMEVAQEAGMEEEYNAVKMANEVMEKSPPPVPKEGSEGGQPREGNIKTDMGMREADMSLAKRGARA